MSLTVATFGLSLALVVGIGAMRLLRRRIDAAIDRNLPDPHWY